ncbi:MAG: hypothetical protein IJ824_05695 [Alphaproteobacteria bacterium]|nr:hypothetical protein [Alphaproteobacteria bacterium]
MPIPFIGAAAAIVATGGAVKTIDAMDDMSTAKRINREAQELADSATRRRENARTNTNSCLEKLGRTKIGIMANSMKNFVDAFGRIKNVRSRDVVGLDGLKDFDTNSREFLDMKNDSFKASELATNGVQSIAAGTATAAAAYGTAMTFGVASTGTAIAGLSGAAATNATLAWLGGGALSAGGAGMFGGAMVLGGLVAAPALVITGLFMGAKADKALSDAHTNKDKARMYDQQVTNECTAMSAIGTRANQVTDVLNKLDKKIYDAVSDLKNVIEFFGTDAKQYNDVAMKKVAIAIDVAKATKQMIDTPMMKENGSLTDESLRMLTYTEHKLQELT